MGRSAVHASSVVRASQPGAQRGMASMLLLGVVGVRKAAEENAAAYVTVACAAARRDVLWCACQQ
jgi:hypothetical protein